MVYRHINNYLARKGNEAEVNELKRELKEIFNRTTTTQMVLTFGVDKRTTNITTNFRKELDKMFSEIKEIYVPYMNQGDAARMLLNLAQTFLETKFLEKELMQAKLFEKDSNRRRENIMNIFYKL